MTVVCRFVIAFVLSGLTGLARGDDPPATATKLIEVQVTDVSGRPIAQPAIRLQQCYRFDFARLEIPHGLHDPVGLDDGADRTDSAGNWRSPPLPPKAAYYVAASVPGFVSEFGRWVHRDESGTVKLSAIKLRRLVTIAGHVKDAAGRPVRGARVFQSGDEPKRVETRTDEDGSFSLSNVPEGPILVFVDAADHFLTGRLIDTSQPPITFTVASRSYDNPERLVRRPRPVIEPLPPEEIQRRRAAAMTEIKLQLESVPENERPRHLASAVRIDPEAGMQLFRQTHFASDQTRSSGLYAVMYGLKDRKCSELELLLPELLAGNRASAIELIVTSQTDSTRRYEWLGRLLREMRGQSEPTNLAFSLARVAENYQRYGFQADAIRLLRQAEQILSELQPSDLAGNVYFQICDTWCAIDQQEAIA